MTAKPDQLFALVAVDQPVDAAYSYEVPVTLRRAAVAGARVLVPLGRGNRLVEGTVLSISDRPPDLQTPRPAAKGAEASEAADEANLFAGADLHEQPESGTAKSGVKAIADVIHDITPVPADLLELAKWISTYYCAPIGMTLASMVPAAVKRGTKLPANVRVSLTDVGRSIGLPHNGTAKANDASSIDGPSIKMSPQARKGFHTLREFLSAGPKLEHEVLAAGQMSRPMLKRLVVLGLLAMEREIKVPEHAPVGASLAEHQLSAAGQRAALDLTPDQQAAMAEIEPLVDGSRGAAGGGVAGAGGDGDGHATTRGTGGTDSGFAVRLIHGVTGSGKTELYIRAIERVVARGKRAIVLVPEISLTPQAVKRFTARFPRVAVLHSGLKNSERAQHWHAIATGWAQVIVGARSAIFAPAADLGLIVVDEEHDSSYKQDSLPKYHGRDVAIRRAQMLGIPILLGSATPALESWHNAHHHASWGLVSLRSRPLGAEMPRVSTVDMKGEAKLRRGLHILSTVLEHHLKQTLAAKKQAIFLLNRRGYAHYLLCPRCDWVLMCDNCDATMVVHRTHSTENNPARAGTGGASGGRGGGAVSSAAREQSARVAARDSVGRKDSRQPSLAAPRHHIEGTVQCHYCLTSMVLPEHCPLCKARLTHLGQGTQRAEDEILRKFPELRGGRLKRMDSDSMSNLGEYQKTLDAFGRGDIDLLIGTQMISKGLDFPNVALVGVLNSDLAMTIPDFRASERTFQLICQVAGRAGRAMAAGGGKATQGSVVVQTFQPGEPAIAYACRHDYLGFVRAELPHRKEFGYPPYGRLVRIVLTHKGYSEVKAFADSLVRLVYALTTKLSLPVRVHGPIPPPMERIMNEYRMEIVLFSDSALPLQRLLASLRARGVLASAKIGVSVDVDPVHML